MEEKHAPDPTPRQRAANQKRIAVAGGTGMLGAPVVRCLRDSGFEVRVLTRDRRKAESMFDSSIEVVQGEPTDPHFIEAALETCQGVHISLPPSVEREVAETIARWAKDRHDVRISYLSGATVCEENRSFPFIASKLAAEQAIVESCAPSTIFCATWFMESLPMFVVNGRATILGNQPTPYHWIAADDLGRMVSAAHALGSGESHRIIVHGPEAIQMLEALRRYCEALQPDIQQVSVTPIWMGRTLAMVTRNSGLREACDLLAYFDHAGEGIQHPAHDCPLPMPRTTLDEWLRLGSEPVGH